MLFDAHYGLMIWTVLSFVLLLLILKKFVYKPILDFIAGRESKVTATIRNAKKQKQESEVLFEKYNKLIAESKKEVRIIIENGKRDAEVKKKEIIEDARKEANQLIERAKAEIKEEQLNALKGLQDKVADISVTMASTLIKQSISKDGHKEIFDDYLTQIENAYGNN